jgi:hypothetical protein
MMSPPLLRPPAIFQRFALDVESHSAYSAVLVRVLISSICCSAELQYFQQNVGAFEFLHSHSSLSDAVLRKFMIVGPLTRSRILIPYRRVLPCIVSPCPGLFAC